MILFCDTSALMKLYAQEIHSNDVRTAVRQASATLVSLITWVEVHAAFSLKQRTQQVTQAQVTAGLARLRQEWDNFTRIAVDTPLITEAAELALRFGLRAYDSMQLASAYRAHQQIGATMRFVCFDKQLVNAAHALGLHVDPV